MKKNFLFVVPLIAMSFATSFGVKPSNVKVDNLDNNICKSNTNKNDDEELIWENDNLIDPGWWGPYRFGTDDTYESKYIIPENHWERLKTETFYLDFNSDGNFTFRLCTYWGNADQYYYPGDPKIIHNAGDSWTFEINLVGTDLAELMDAQDFFLTGSGYIPLKLYFLNPIPSYTVTFDLNGGQGTAPDKETVEEGGYATKPETDPTHAPDEEHTYTFKYWSDSQTGEAPFVFESTPITDDITLYAIWEPHDINKYTVTFDTMGYGKPIEPQIIKEDGLVSEPEAPSAFALKFDAWYKEKEYMNKWDFSTDTIKADTTLYAKWIDEVEEIKVTSTPEKTDYVIGEDLNLKGLKIQVKNKEGITETIDVTNDMISGFDKNKVGEQTITITYGDQTTTFTIVVASNALPPVVIIGIIIDSFAALVIIIYFLICLYNHSKNKLSKKS